MNKANTCFSDQLLTWYFTSFRPLPWRETKDPYAIWLSEVILQQTRVDQGTKYYFAFLEQFPTLIDLANAPLDEVLRLWQGLGYYSRARNLHAAAKHIRDEHLGIFPSSYQEILKLPGIGPYTAAAISSFAFNISEAAVDGNVYRFLSRLYGIDTPIDSTKGQKEFKQLAQSLISNEQPGSFNQATMEFGATVCKPTNPLCDQCIFREQCAAFKNHLIKALPVKSNKTKVRNRFLIFLFFEDSLKQTLIQQRNNSDIWASLYQFPLLELDAMFSDFGTFDLSQAHPFFSANSFQVNQVSNVIQHVLSHQKLNARFIHLKVEKLPTSFFKNSEALAIDELHTKAFPRLITRYLENSTF